MYKICQKLGSSTIIFVSKNEGVGMKSLQGNNVGLHNECHVEKLVKKTLRSVKSMEEPYTMGQFGRPYCATKLNGPVN